MSTEENLPEGWVLTKLRDIVFPGNTQHLSQLRVQNFLYVDIEALDNQQQKIVSPKKLLSSEAPGRARLVLHKDDVIFSLTRPYLKNIAIVPQELDDQIASTAYCVMRPEDGISSHFVFYLISRDDFINSIPTYGDSPPAAHDDEFLAMDIPIAPTNEQSRIVAAIEQQFTRLDSAVASLRSAKARAKQYRASLLKSAVEGELTKEWRTTHPVSETGAQLLQRILTERRKRWEEAEMAKMREKGIIPKDDEWKQRYKEPQKPDVEHLSELPEGWCWATVEQISYSVRYGTSAKTSNDDTGIPVLRMGNIQDGGLDFTNLKYLPSDHPELSALLLEKGDLLFNRTNSAELVGKSAIYRSKFTECSYASYLIGVKLLMDHLADLLCFYINSHYGRVWVKSVSVQQTGQANVNGSKLQALAFPLPSIAEIEQIVAEVEAKLSNITQLEATIETDLKRAEHERQSILREAFAGRLVPQDPNDEPASVLLERIRAERKRREADEQTSKEKRKMAIVQQRKKSKNVAPLYDVLVEAGGTLAPEELYQYSDNQRKNIPEEVRDESFYIELDAEMMESLIREDRSSSDKILLQALNQINDELGKRAEVASPPLERRPKRMQLELDLNELPNFERGERPKRMQLELDLDE